jgi:EpsI family protein
VTAAKTPGAASSRAGFAARVDWRSWYVPVALAAVVLLTGVLYWPSAQSLLFEWFDVPASAYRHGSLIVAITLWLLIRAARDDAPPVVPGAAIFLPLTLLAAASLAWLIAVRAGVQVAHQALLPIIIWLNIRIIFGQRIAVRSLVPIGLLYSAIPIWHVFVPALQAMTISVVSALLRIVAIPAYVTGDFVHIRSGVFHVEDGCAGLHYFIVAATIAVLHGELRGDRRGTRLYLLGLAIALALASNWLRVFIIIVAGDLTNMQHYLVRVDHSVFGWVVFAVAMGVFVLLGRRGRPPAAEPRAEVGSASERVDALPRGAARASAVALFASAIGPAWLLLLPLRTAAAANVAVPTAIEGWAGPRESCRGRWRPQYRTADLHSQHEFSRGGAAVCFYSATYLIQHQDKELIGYSTSAYDPNGEIVSAGARDVADRTVNEVQLGNETGSDRIVWYAYVVGEREMRRGVAAQLSYALGSLHGTPAASVYAISASCVPDCASARQLLTDFLPHVTVGTKESVK